MAPRYTTSGPSPAIRAHRRQGQPLAAQWLREVRATARDSSRWSARSDTLDKPSAQKVGCAPTLREEAVRVGGNHEGRRVAEVLAVRVGGCGRDAGARRRGMGRERRDSVAAVRQPGRSSRRDRHARSCPHDSVRSAVERIAARVRAAERRGRSSAAGSERARSACRGSDHSGLSRVPPLPLPGPGGRAVRPEREQCDSGPQLARESGPDGRQHDRQRARRAGDGQRRDRGDRVRRAPSAVSTRIGPDGIHQYEGAVRGGRRRPRYSGDHRPRRSGAASLRHRASAGGERHYGTEVIERDAEPRGVGWRRGESVPDGDVHRERIQRLHRGSARRGVRPELPVHPVSGEPRRG